MNQFSPNNTQPDNDLILACWKIEDPHWMKPDELCMGSPTEGYWRVFAHHRSEKNNTAIGCGKTREDCVNAVKCNILTRSLPPAAYDFMADVQKRADFWSAVFRLVEACGGDPVKPFQERGVIVTEIESIAFPNRTFAKKDQTDVY